MVYNWTYVIACQTLCTSNDPASAGFHTEGGGGAGIPPPPPPPETLKLSMVIIVLSQVLNNNLVPDCIRSYLRGSKILNFSGGACPQTPLIGTHAYACVSVLLRATITMLPSCIPPPPPQLKILYETLKWTEAKSMLLTSKWARPCCTISLCIASQDGGTHTEIYKNCKNCLPMTSHAHSLLQWNPSIMDTIGNQNFVRYREVSPAQGFPVYFR